MNIIDFSLTVLFLMFMIVMAAHGQIKLANKERTKRY